MTDDELKIRHVRLCQCGKLAGHEGICRPGQLAAAQRVDQAWADHNAERRTERHARLQPGFRADRRVELDAMSNLELAAIAAIRAAKLSPIPAGNVAPSHGNAAHPSVNLALQAPNVDLTRDPRWKATHERERRSLLRKHELLDEYEGLGVAQAERELSADEKDAEIVAENNEHLSAHEFARQFPGYGSPSTIARKRGWFKRDRCTFNGLAPRPGCHCPTCRRASV